MTNYYNFIICTLHLLEHLVHNFAASNVSVLCVWLWPWHGCMVITKTKWDVFLIYVTECWRGLTEMSCGCTAASCPWQCRWRARLPTYSSAGMSGSPCNNTHHHTDTLSHHQGVTNRVTLRRHHNDILQGDTFTAFLDIIFPQVIAAKRDNKTQTVNK